MKNLLDLSGRVALVTGASSGIGAATAAALAAAGARVAVAYHKNEAGAADVVRSIVQSGGTAERFQADVVCAEELGGLINDVTAQFGAIDVLVNNAGSLVQRLPLLAPAEDWEQSFTSIVDLNLTSAALCSRAVAPKMVERKRGAIVNVVSIAGYNGGGPGAGPYAAAKAALGALTKSMAKELAPQGVRVNAVSPGVIDTPFHQVFSTPEMLRNAVAAIPAGRIGTPEECANVILFLASDAASYVIGETVHINGGQLMV